MEVSFRLRQKEGNREEMAVSILVLMEVSFRQIVENLLVDIPTAVSILVLMEVSFRLSSSK